MIEILGFYILSVLVITLFLITIFTKSIIYSMSSLASGMIIISGFFFMLNADFIGAVQIIVYSGVVIALYMFGIMFFNLKDSVKERVAQKRVIYTLSILGALILVLAILLPVKFGNATVSCIGDSCNVNIANPSSLGIALFTKYLVPFELAAIMLLVAMIGGIIFVSKKMDNSITLDEDIDKEFNMRKRL